MNVIYRPEESSAAVHDVERV